VDQTDDIRDQACSIRVDGGPGTHIAAHAGEILLEINGQAVGQVLLLSSVL
jgi:hypothetical protein